MKTIAVYGSLKRGKYNHDMIAGSKRLGISYMPGTMYLISTYPAFVPEPENSEALQHTFELYEVDEKVYERVSSMELGAGYDEETREFNIGNGKVVSAIFYPASKFLQEHCEKSRPIIHDY